jgi:type VI secretion system protein ImpH
MVTYGWGTDHSVAEWLFAEGFRFEFYQAVKLLELLNPTAVAVGEGAMPQREAVRFKSHVGFAFPASEVVAVTPAAHHGVPAEMTVTFLGLAGGLGPLPAAYTEWLLERIWQRDTALRDFLEIFNHRLVSLMHRVRKMHRIGLAIEPPGEDPVAHYLFALMGLGTPGLQGRMLVKDRALLFYAGLLAQRPRSMAGLEHVLADYFGITVKGQQCLGQWQHLAAEQWTSIGVSGRNQGLGLGVVLGRRVWDQQGRFEIHLGPLSLAQFLDFLPIGSAFHTLCELTRFYVGPQVLFSLRLTLQAAEVPASRLSTTGGPRLAWTSWLKTRAFAADDSQVRLRGAVL